MRRTVIGIMGAGDATERDLRLAEELGELVAAQGWVVLTGGRPEGVLDAASRGAHKVPGALVVGILPSESGGVSRHVDVAVFTGMGHARNVVNVLSSSVVVVCGVGGPGTASEAALALKVGRPLILLAPAPEAEAFFRSLGGALFVARKAREVIDLVRANAGSDLES
jgi:uncharacterized protein (TIGR00725 family)